MTSRDRDVFDFAGAGLEVLWSALAARWPSAAVATVRPAIDRPRVLVLAPHPDDESAGAGGAILLHRRAGHAVTIACATDGGASRALNRSPEETGTIRRAEAEAAARILEAKLAWIGLPERHWSIDQLVSRLVPLLEGVELIYAPSRVDAHPEHFNVAHALAVALEAARSTALIRVYAIYVPLTPLLTNVALDVSAELDHLRAALAAHQSQAHSIERTLRLRRYAARMHRAATHAEVFWELDAASYVALHRDLPSTWKDRFFGVRLRAFRDPLAYVLGTAARRRLRR